MTWAGKRKLVYLSVIAAIVLAVIVIPSIFYFYKTPTCFDGKQNQTELGIDCGGPCQLLCPVQFAPLNVLWSRFFKVSDGVYNALAYVENPNLTAQANNLNYVFKLYDQKGLLLEERAGQTFSPAGKILTIFEPELFTGNQRPARLEFAFTSPAVWFKVEKLETDLAVTEAALTRLETSPRLEFTLTNKTTKLIKQIEVVGIIYDTDGNTVAFSRTIVDSLTNKEARVVSLNWPLPFTGTPARNEIVFKILK